MQYSEGKIIPYRKRLFYSAWGIKSFFKRNGDYITIVSVSGFLKNDDMKRIDKIVESDLKSGASRFIVNFSNVNHMHYKAVHLLLHIKDKVKKYKGEIKIVAKAQYIIDILFVGGWPFVYYFYPSEKTAIQAFRWEYSLTRRENVFNTYPGSSE